MVLGNCRQFCLIFIQVFTFLGRPFSVLGSHRTSTSPRFMFLNVGHAFAKPNWMCQSEVLALCELAKVFGRAEQTGIAWLV